MPKHALVIYNPATKTQLDSDAWLGRVIEELNRHDTFLVTFYPTTPKTRPQDLVPLLKPPLDVVIVAGGDGTVRFALAALAQARSPIPAAILPMGTGNVLARNLGIVEQKFFANPLAHAFENIVHGRSVRIDMGMMNGEYFAGMAGVGPISDAFVTPRREYKTNFKLFAYVHSMLDSITKPSSLFKITTSGVSFEIEASGVFVANVEDLGLAKPCDIETLTDGYLNLHVLNPKHFADYIDVGAKFVAGMETRAPYYILKVKEAIIETSQPSRKEGKRHKAKSMPAMIDGEFHGVTPMRITVIPAAVNVLVPPVADDANPEALGSAFRSWTGVHNVVQLRPDEPSEGQDPVQKSG